MGVIKWIEKNYVFAGVPATDDYLFQPKIAAFNFDIVNIIDKKKQIQKYKELCDQYTIAFFSAATANSKCAFEDFYIEMRQQDIHILGFFSTRANCYSKPYTGMWKLLDARYEMLGKKCPDRKECYYVGNLAGRPTYTNTKKYPAKCADNSAVDRAFAYNCGVKFCVPEQFFEKIYHPRDYQWRYDDSEKILSKPDRISVLEKNKFSNPFRHGAKIIFRRLFGDAARQYLIIIIGPPASGKKTIANMIMADINCAIVVDEKSLRAAFARRKSAILYNNTHKRAYRRLYMNVAAECGVSSILYLSINIRDNILHQLNHMKIEISNNPELIAHAPQKYADYKKNKESITNAELTKKCRIINFRFYPIAIKEWWFIFI